MNKVLGFIKEEGLALVRNKTVIIVITITVALVGTRLLSYKGHVRTDRYPSDEDGEEIRSKIKEAIESKGFRVKTLRSDSLGGWFTEFEIERKGNVDTAYSAGGKMIQAIWKRFAHPLNKRP